MLWHLANNSNSVLNFVAVKLAAAAKEGSSCPGMVVMQSVKIAMVAACMINLY